MTQAFKMTKCTKDFNYVTTYGREITDNSIREIISNAAYISHRA